MSQQTRSKHPRGAQPLPHPRLRRPFLLLALFLLGGAALPAQAFAIGAITGTVTAADSGARLSHIEVCVAKTTEDIPYQCMATDFNGEYFFGGLPDGDYRVGFYPSTGTAIYLRQYYNGRDSWEGSDLVAVTSGHTTDDIDAQLKEGGRVEGTVVNAFTDAPIEGLEACALFTATQDFARCDITDENGKYEIVGLAPDSYRVQFRPEELNYIRQYYDGKANFGGATSLTLGLGQKIAGIDAEMQPGAQIRGTVTAVGGAPIEAIGVCISTADPDNIIECAQTDSDGDYTVPRLLPGTYKVAFLPSYNNLNYLPQYYDGRQSLGSGDTLTLAAGEVAEGIDAELLPGGQIRGQAIDADTKDPIPSTEVCLYRADETDGEEHERCTWADGNGEYVLAGLDSGTYKVGFFAVNEYEGTWGPNYVGEFYDGKPALAEAMEIPVEPGDDINGIDVEMRVGARILGTVTDAVTKDVVQGVRVCAIAPVPGQPKRCSYSNPSGEYAIAGLDSGSYKVVFFEGWDGIYVPQYYEAKLVAEEAEPVAVTAGFDTTGIDAEMVEGGRIAGRVVDAATNDPIEEIVVCALDSDGERVSCEWTGPDGEFTIWGLPTGSYKVVFAPSAEEGLEEEGFETRYYDEETSFADAEPVAVTLSVTTPGIDARLLRLEGTELPPSNIQAPLLTGSPALGATLSCSEGEWENDPTEFTYRWLRDGALIKGETSATYVVHGADEGHSIACEVTATNTTGEASETSDPVDIPPREETPKEDSPTEEEAVPPSSGPNTTESPAAAFLPSPDRYAPPQGKRLTCRKGFTKRKVQGKPKCVKAKRAKAKHRQRHPR